MENAIIERLCAKPVEYQGCRVITLAQMDEAHGRPDGTAGRAFRSNREKLIEGEDYFLLPQEVVTTLNIATSKFMSGPMILLAESGYLMLVKTFRDGLAWKVQRALVSTYFRAAREGSGDTLLDSLQALVLLRRCQLATDQRAREAFRIAGEAKQLAQATMDTLTSNHGCYSVLAFARRRGWEMPVQVAAGHGRKLTKICRGAGVEVHQVDDPRFGLVNIYPESVLDGYFDDASDA